MIQFRQHSTRHVTTAATLRTWRSTCGRYTVTQSISLFGLSTVYYAALRSAYGWSNLKANCRFPHFRTRAAAIKGCAQHCRQRRYS